MMTQMQERKREIQTIKKVAGSALEVKNVVKGKV